MWIKSMNSLYLSTTNEDISIQLIKKSSNTTKDAFVHIGVKLAELPNQKRDTVRNEREFFDAVFAWNETM